MDQPLSPLEPLDPHRLRDMVMDKQQQQQQSVGTPHQQAHWMQQQTANTVSPASIGSPHSMVNQRMSAGSVEMSSPFQARPSSTHPQQHMQQPGSSFDFNNPRTPMYPPQQPTPSNVQQQQQMPTNCSPTKSMIPQHIMSPIGRSPQQQQQIGSHPPASPFQRSSSAASNSCPSPFSQPANPQYPVHPQMYPPSSAYPSNVRLPPSYPNPAGAMPPQHQQPIYPQYPSAVPPWAGQNMNPHYMNQLQQQQRMMYASGASAVYPTGMPPPGMSQQQQQQQQQQQISQQISQQQQAIMYGRPAANAVPRPPSSASSSQSSSINYAPPSSLGKPSHTPGGGSNIGAPGAPQQQQMPLAAPGTPINANTPASVGVHYGTPQHQQTPTQYSNLQQQSDVAPPGTPLATNQQQQIQAPTQGRFLVGQQQHPTNGQAAINPQQHQHPPQNMRSPPLVSPTQAQIPPGAHPQQMIRQQVQLPPNQPPMHPQQQQPIQQQQHSIDMVNRGMMPSGGQLVMPQGVPPSQSGAPRPHMTPTGNGGGFGPYPVFGAPPGTRPLQMMGGEPVPGTPTRMPLQMRVPPLFYDHQFFQLKQTYPSPDLFLVGCHFFIPEELGPLPVDLHDLAGRLRLYGAEVETNLAALAQEQRVTHVVCESWGVKARQVAKHPVRLITTSWLSDTLAKRKLEAPTRASHLPTFWPETQQPGNEKLISSEGFNESETLCIRALCRRVGAHYTTYFTKNHAALISKSENGEKSQQARDWKIPLLNYMWLVRLYFGNIQMINEIGREIHKPSADPNALIDCSPHFLEKISDYCIKLLGPWRMPIVVNDEIMGRAAMIRQQAENDTALFPYKKLKQLLPAPNDEQITLARQILERNSKLPNIRVFIDGFPREMAETLARKARFLGAQVAESIIESTHFVCSSLKRSPNLLEALARGRNIVEPAWIEHSYRMLRFVDSFDFHVRDLEQERKFRFNPLNTIYRARERAVFEDVTFHLSASVQPSLDLLRSLIEAAGGTVELEKPRLKRIAEHIRYDKTFLVVVNEADAVEYSYLYAKRIPIFHEEFVFMSILRHRLDTSSTFRLNPPITSEQPKFAKNPMKTARQSQPNRLEKRVVA